MSDTRHEVFNNLQAVVSLGELLAAKLEDRPDDRDAVLKMLEYVKRIEVTCNKYMSVKSENAVLQQTLADRKLIEKAKGMLMSRHGWTEDKAFSVIRRTAMDRRTTMAILSEQVIAGGWDGLN